MRLFLGMLFVFPSSLSSLYAQQQGASKGTHLHVLAQGVR